MKKANEEKKLMNEPQTMYTFVGLTEFTEKYLPTSKLLNIYSFFKFQINLYYIKNTYQFMKIIRLSFEYLYYYFF